MKLMISSLHLFPIKACAGIEVGGLEITASGPAVRVGDKLIGDRQYMFVSKDGEFRSQRTHPSLALMKPTIENDKLFLIIDSEKFELPERIDADSRSAIKLFGKNFKAPVFEGPITDAASKFLGEPVALTIADNLLAREVSVKNEFLGVETRWTDSQQFLVISEESLEDLNKKLVQKISKDRFRANIWLKGGFAYREDQMTKIMHSDYELAFTKACARCKVITVNQQVGKVESSEPLQLLAQYRKRENQVYFGDYFLSRNTGSVIKLFDPVQAEF